MTCVIGIVNNENIYIGADSAGVSGYSITIRADEKVFKNGPFIMGGTTSFRMLQLLRYKFDPPKQTAGTDDMKYMVTDFIDSVRKIFGENGFGNMGDKSHNSGGTFLVGYNSKLYTIHDDFQVGVASMGFDSVGCGSELALGSLHSTKGKKPEERIRMALDAASCFNAGVAPPFVILKQLKIK